jgi:hypothetical protein
MTDLSAFDAAFQATALPLHYEQFGEVMAYTPPGGAAIEGVRVIPEERDREHDAGEFGQMRTAERMGRILTADAKLQAAGVAPARGGILTRASGARLKIDGAPREDNGEWVLDLVEAPA